MVVKEIRGRTPYRLFLPTGEELALWGGDCAISHATVYLPDKPIAWYTGHFTLVATADGNERRADLLDWMDDRIRCLLGATVHVYHIITRLLLRARVDSCQRGDGREGPLPAVLIGGLGFSIQSSGAPHELPQSLECHLPQIVAFEATLPGSLAPYCDWCDEQRWDERHDELRAQWEKALTKAGA